MHDVIEKLLILQDCDRRILRAQTELAGIAPQRAATQTKLASAAANLDDSKLRGKKIESERKKLELEVDAKQLLIEKYAGQQLLTRKNEEYRALAHEIDGCKEVIAKLEDGQLEFMEQADTLAREIAVATRMSAEIKKEADAAVSALAEMEVNLSKQLDEVLARRGDLASAVEEGVLHRYERLFKQRGGNVLVGIDHAVCGGCHMKLPAQVLIACRTAAELNACPHCGRILYYTRDMELIAAE